jgi:hypothetical protein
MYPRIGLLVCMAGIILWGVLGNVYEYIYSLSFW